jgi:hypothetical protein
MDVRHALDVILTTPQPKDDGTGIVSVRSIPLKPAAKQPQTPGERNQPPAQQVPAQKAAAAPKKKSPATLWLSISGIVTVLGLASFFALGGKPVPAARVQPVSASPVDAAFLAQVAAAPAARQVELVQQKIEALNGTKVSAEPTIKGQEVTGLRLFRADDTEGEVPDVSPLAALKNLDSLHLQYLYPTDISCLRGLKLVNLRIWGGNFNDLSVLQSHPLQRLSLKQTQVSDFSMLKDKALQDLDLEWCHRLSDLSFIKGLPIKYLNVTKTKVHDLSPIAGLPLVELVCDPEAKLDPALLASIPTLKKINLKPVSEWQGGSSNMPPSATLDEGVRTAATVADATKLKAGKIDGKWRDGLGEWITYREGRREHTDLKSDESGRQVVQKQWTDIWLPVSPDEQKPLNGSIRAKAKGGKFRLSLRTHRDGVYGGVLFSYGAGFEGNTLKIWRFEDQQSTFLPGAIYPLPGKFDPSASYELEFRATGSLLELFLNGERVLTGHDPSPVPGHFRFGADKGVVVESVEIRIDGFGDDKRMQGDLPASRAPVKTESSSVSSANPSAPSPTSWTDWLGPRLAKGQYQGNGFIHEKDGLTTDLGMKGTNITADDTTDGAIKLTYLLRDSKGAQITVRNRGTGPTRELYVVEDSGSGMYIGRVFGDKTTMLVSEKYPANISRSGERTLEFRAEGAALVATVNGTFSVTTHDTTLTKGPSSFVIMKGLLLEKVEVQVLKRE